LTLPPRIRYTGRMKQLRILFAACGVILLSAATQPKSCEGCEFWSQPGEPFHVFGNTWYVGPANLSSVLIHSKDGAILLDGGLPQTAPQIMANIRKLGFKVEDVRIIVNSHAHYDHAGGIAELQQATGARVYASKNSRKAFENGKAMPDDPQYAFGDEHNSFPAIHQVHTVKDGETLKLGSLAITAHYTPGHTQGGTTWTWRDCEAQGAGQRCIDIVYADSLNSVSAPGFRFSGDTTHPSRVEMFERSMDKIAALPCDLLLAPHPELVDVKGKLAKRAAHAAENPFIDASACRTYAEAARERLHKRVIEEGAGTPARASD
jgi:metallo-beta-lactamase class B